MDITLAGIPGASTVQKETLSSKSSAPAFGGNGENLGYLNPGPTYLPPASSMYFGSSGRGQSLIDFLPAESAANYLIEQYILSPASALNSASLFDSASFAFTTSES